MRPLCLVSFLDSLHVNSAWLYILDVLDLSFEFVCIDFENFFLHAWRLVAFLPLRLQPQREEKLKWDMVYLTQTLDLTIK